MQNGMEVYEIAVVLHVTGIDGLMTGKEECDCEEAVKKLAKEILQNVTLQKLNYILKLHVNSIKGKIMQY